MAILKILQYPDLRLRRVAEKVTDIKNERVQKIIDDMFETLAVTEACAALAATQLDIDISPQIIVINSSLETDEPFCLINPEIIYTEGSNTSEEGCMSIYPSEYSALVERFQRVKVRAIDRLGKQLEIDAKDFLAKVLQHEIDHLYGKLYIDKLSKLKRSRFEKKIAKLLYQNDK